MHPFITINGHSFSTYWLMAELGALASLVYILIISIRKKMSFQSNAIYMLYGIPAAFFGAILLYFITRLRAVLEVISCLFTDFRYFSAYVSVGFVYYGGFFGFLAGLIFNAHLTHRDTRYMLYYMIPAIPLFHAFGRIGCYFAGCCYGINGIPVQLIESGCNFMIFIMLCIIIRREHRPFFTLGMYMTVYGTIRFILEFFRGDMVRGILLGLSTSQWISLIVIPLGIYNICTPNEKNHFNKWFNGE